MKKTILSLSAAFLVATSASNAAAFSTPDSPLSAPAFQDLVRDAGHILSFPAADQADSYGLVGFDAGLGYQLGILDAGAEHWEALGGPSFWNQGYLRAVKGLPGDIDVGVMGGMRLFEEDYVVGGEVRWNFYGDGLVLPAIGARLAYTQTVDMELMSLRTFSAQAHISKSFLIITPYGGIGYTGAYGSPKADVVVDSASAFANLPHAWAGIQYTPFPFLSVTLQGQYALEAPPLFTLQLSAGLGGS